MTLIVDAGPLYSQADRRDPDHEVVVEALRRERGALVVPSFVATEADYLILTRLGVDAELAFLEDLAEGTYEVAHLTRDEVRVAAGVARRYRDLPLGLADASIVVVAARFRTTRLLTFDERAFRAVRPLAGRFFTLLPADV